MLKFDDYKTAGVVNKLINELLYYIYIYIE